VSHHARSDKLVPLIVGGPIFMQNLDSTAMAIAIPAISRSLRVAPVYLNLAITSYLLSLAAFLPLSAWMADRFGARRMFGLAIVLFSVGSALCGTANSLLMLVTCRIVQGFGAALMLPVGRLIMLRNVDRSKLLSANVWFTLPAVVGRLSGPLVGAAIVTFASWHWIFFLNIPVGLAILALTLYFVEDTGADARFRSFDLSGFLLLALGLIALTASFESITKPFVASSLAWGAAGLGLVFIIVYVRRSARHRDPVVDLRILRFHVFRSNVLGAMPLRIGIGAAPFLLPLFLQVGLGLSPLATGMLTVGSAVGALLTRVVLRSVADRLGVYRLLLIATLLTASLHIAYGFFDRSTPWTVMFGAMLGGGLFTSLCLVTLNSLAFVGIPEAKMSHATALTAMAQQLSASIGVAIGSALLIASTVWRGDQASHVIATDFAVTFVFVGILTMLSMYSFYKLPRDVGIDIR
jgi:EmrB/QacA subfamily drug resistance transporter